MTYKTKGTCASQIDFEIEDGTLKSCRFTGGCDGNHKGICSLCVGMKIDDIIEKLGGIKCGYKATSCPDQLAVALREYKESKE